MKYRIITLVAAMIMLSNLALGAAIDMNENDIVDNTIIKDDVTYRIAYSTETYFNGNSMKRIFVENLNRIKKLESIQKEIAYEYDNKENKLSQLQETITDLRYDIIEKSSILDVMEEQRDLSEQDMMELQDEKKELENMITANIVVSPNTYNTGIVIFVILIAAVLILKGRKMFRNGKKTKKKETKKETKKDTKKRDLEVVAEEIRKRPDEGGIITDY